MFLPRSAKPFEHRLRLSNGYLSFALRKEIGYYSLDKEL